jgi:hypothetical protein
MSLSLGSYNSVVKLIRNTRPTALANCFVRSKYSTREVQIMDWIKLWMETLVDEEQLGKSKNNINNVIIILILMQY